MKRKITYILSILMLLNGISAFAWGPKGHDVVAAIAEQNLTKKAKKRISELLDGKSIVYYSSWMDNIQNSPYWEDGYYKTKTWHYANVDKGLTYETMKKNENGDVVAGLTMLTDQMMNNYENLTDSMRVDYLKMIVHMVGDLHCPMHAGRFTDLGGNRTKVMWFRQETNLHSVWDSKMIDAARKWSYTEWCDQLDRTSKKYKKEVMCGTYEEWFTTTVAAAADIYEYVESTGEVVPSLSYQFVYDFSPLLEEQLLHAGYRLAYVLNEIFD
ncbi:MAG: S1/P1 nuclease [Bacteroidales bacterium]|nr:S1/P1 nuclease [Bacteroidales bacterium]